MPHCEDHQHHHGCDHHKRHVDHVEVIVEASQTIDHDEHHQIHDNAADEGLQREAGISVLHHRSSPSAPAQESPMVVQLLRRRFRGQRKYKRAEPAIASASPPPANPISQGVLKSSWFFQSMMWRPQKKS
ncbi:hypothetical protein D9M73_103690 [compost metagenome]